MNIYRFINSKDIRFHLQSLRYDFTLPEAAFLVWQCIDATLEEKHEAWCELIRTMPDCGMQKRRNMSAIKSMHDLLQDYMKLEQKLLREFYQETDAVYFFNLSERDNSFPNGFSETEKFNRAFLNLSSCLAAIKGGIDGIDPRNILRIEIKKQRLSVPENTLTICMNSKLEVMDIDAFRYLLTEREQELLGAFEGMWFAFPTPFKRGDIVYRKNSLKEWHCQPDTCYVLDSISSWTTKEMQENKFATDLLYAQDIDRLHRNLLKNGDVTDMSFSAYSVEDGQIIFDNVGWYLSLERFDGTLTGAQRALYPLRDLLNGKIRPDMFLDALRVLRADEEAKNTAWIRENLLYHKNMSYISAENTGKEAGEKEETL